MEKTCSNRYCTFRTLGNLGYGCSYRENNMERIRKNNEMKVGDKVWLFSENWREYISSQSAPIYEKHFRQFIIESETTKSWIVNGDKFSKKNTIGLYTDEQKSDKIWDNINRYKIGEKVRCCSIAQLKRVNSILETPRKEN